MYNKSITDREAFQQKSWIDLAVCILFHEKVDQTIHCIKSFLESGIKIYILNNASSRLSSEKLRKFCEKYGQITIWNSDINLGVGVGRNFLLAHTTEKWLLFVDNDIFIRTQNWLNKIKHHILTNKDIEVFIPKLFNNHEREFVKYGIVCISKDNRLCRSEPLDDFINFFPGGASIVNRTLFDRLGDYDTKMFVGFEDYELSIRAIRLGDPIKARLIHDIELIHDHRSVKTIEDQKAVQIRYDINLNENSYNRMIGKYNITPESNWKIWLSQQVEYSLKTRSQITDFIKKVLLFPQFSPKLSEIFVKIEKRMPTAALNIIREFILKINSIPTMCTLYLTNKCNLKCQCCRRNIIGTENFKDMSLIAVKRLLTLYPMITSFCVAGYGEPTLATEFAEIVNFLKEHGKSVGIITNGTNFDKIVWLSYNPDYISISLNGYDNESYLKNTGLPVFNKVMDTYFKIKAKFKNIGFSYILKKTNYTDLDKVLSLCDKNEPDFLNLLNYLVYNPNLEEEISKIITVSDKEIINYIDTMCINHNFKIQKPIYIDFKNPRFNCKSYNYLINLDGEGNIGGCLRQIPPNALFGNVFKNKDPFNSKQMRIFREKMYKTGCAHGECRFCFGNWG